MQLHKLTAFPALLAFALLVGCSSAPEETFSSPDEAASTLVTALRAQDEARLKKILGSDYQELLYSGDEVADKQAIKHFLDGYDQKHIFVSDTPASSQADQAPADDSVVIAVGEDAWPMAIPIVKDPQTNTWSFSPEDGREELLSRRIGYNELETIQVCLAIVDAQREYAARDPQKVGRPNYATKLISSPGKRDGLYWPASADGPYAKSPLGPLIGKASQDGYQLTGSPAPYHGYRYRMLPSQTIPNHPGRGVVNYVQPNNYVLGFAVVAYPAKYGNSGVMTFIVNQRGIVYQKDLGSDTASIAQNMTTYDPADGWTKADAESSK